MKNETHRKNSQRPKNCNLIDLNPVIVFMQNSDESDQVVPRKLDFECETQRDVTNGKKRKHFDMSSCENASLAHLNKKEQRGAGISFQEAPSHGTN